MATIFESGLETETDAFTTEWDSKTVSVGNSLTVASGAGEYNSGVKGGKVLVDGDGLNCYVKKSFTEGSEFYCRAYFKLPSGLAYDSEYKVPIEFSVQDGTTGVAYAWVRGDGSATFQLQFKLRHAGGLATIYQGGVDSLSLNVWHYVEMHWVKGTGANGGLECKLDGALLDSELTYDCTAYDVDNIVFGVTGDGDDISGSQSIYFDDVEVNDSAWPGAVSSGVEIAPGTLTTALQMFNPIVKNNSGLWDMGPYIYTEAETGVAINPPLLQTQLQIHDPVVYAVDVPTAVAPPLLQTNIQMFNPTVNAGKFRNRICSMLHLIMGR